jgi:hypothetical protein
MTAVGSNIKTVIIPKAVYKLRAALICDANHAEIWYSTALGWDRQGSPWHTDTYLRLAFHRNANNQSVRGNNRHRSGSHDTVGRN